MSIHTYYKNKVKVKLDDQFIEMKNDIVIDSKKGIVYLEMDFDDFKSYKTLSIYTDYRGIIEDRILFTIIIDSFEIMDNKGLFYFTEIENKEKLITEIHKSIHKSIREGKLLRGVI